MRERITNRCLREDLSLSVLHKGSTVVSYPLSPSIHSVRLNPYPGWGVEPDTGRRQGTPWTSRQFIHYRAYALSHRSLLTLGSKQMQSSPPWVRSNSVPSLLPPCGRHVPRETARWLNKCPALLAYFLLPCCPHQAVDCIFTLQYLGMSPCNETWVNWHGLPSLAKGNVYLWAFHTWRLLSD